MKLNSKFYSREALEGAIAAFRQMCDISCAEKEGYFHLNFSPEEEKIDQEFANYCLGLMKR